MPPNYFLLSKCVGNSILFYFYQKAFYFSGLMDDNS